MKKVLIAVVLIVSVMLVGCGNMSVGVGNYEFKGIHIGTYNGVGCHEIESWHDNESGIEVKIKGGNSIYVSEGTTYILYEEECPICSKNNKTNNVTVSDINLQTSSDNSKTPLEWAKIEIASDARYDGKEIVWAVMPIEWHEIDYNEAMYIIIAMTEDYDLVLDYYGVQLNWTVDSEKVSVDQVKVDAELFKTEIIGDDGVILDYDNGKIIGDDGEVVIGENSQTSGN